MPILACLPSESEGMCDLVPQGSPPATATFVSGPAPDVAVAAAAGSLALVSAPMQLGVVNDKALSDRAR